MPASVVALLVLLVGLFIGGPLITIWALNTLFSLNIPINLFTWIATCWVVFILTSRSNVKVTRK